MAKKNGRPLIKIDWKKAEKLCFIHCTGEEMAAILEVDYDTLVRAIVREYRQTFAEYFKKHSSGGRASLRRMQFKAAEAGKPTMLIWLGKQHLGQQDKILTENTGIIGISNISKADYIAARKKMIEDDDC